MDRLRSPLSMPLLLPLLLIFTIW